MNMVYNINPSVHSNVFKTKRRTGFILIGNLAQCVKFFFYICYETVLNHPNHQNYSNSLGLSYTSDMVLFVRLTRKSLEPPKVAEVLGLMWPPEPKPNVLSKDLLTIILYLKTFLNSIIHVICDGRSHVKQNLRDLFEELGLNYNLPTFFFFNTKRR